MDKSYYSLLSKEEKTKADSFSRLELQQKYSQTRGILRKILATQLNCHPQKIIIKTGEHGKPFITHNAIHFNLSHTGNRFVIATSNCTVIGVDIEQPIPRKSLPALVKKCFSDVEADYWTSLPDQQKVDMFFRFWVRKEAFVKAIGRGIALGLNQCVINPEDQNTFLDIPMEYGSASHWKITEPFTNNLNVCSVVTKNVDFEMRLLQWE
jgi:4'-phosphopantetheinyl transferase